jgi:hypothetical protein
MVAAMGTVLLLLVTVTAVSLPSTLGTNGLHFVFANFRYLRLILPLFSVCGPHIITAYTDAQPPSAC